MSSRKRYRPRPVNTNPLTKLRPADPERREIVLARFRSALHCMAHGSNPGEEEWRDLSDAINTVECMALGLHKLDPSEVMPAINAAIAGMVAAAKRFKAGQGMRLDAAGLEAIRTVIDYYRQCCEGYTEHEMAMAQAETERRVHMLQRSKKPSHEVISL